MSATTRLGSAEAPALAFLEFSSISRGLYVTDVAVKRAEVRILFSQPVSSGKHALLFAGDVASVVESHAAAVAAGDGTIVRDILIPGVHADLAPFLQKHLGAANGEARTETLMDALDSADSLATCESSTLAGAVLAADRALKTAPVRLIRMRLGQHIGGKAYFVIAGAQSDIEASADAALRSLIETESLARVDVIPRPEAQAVAFF